MAGEKPTFEGWAILELMGHRRLGGYIREVTVAGAGFLRIDVPCEPPATQFYPPSSVYCLTPTTEEAAKAVAKHNRPAPIQRWELPALEDRSEDRVDSISVPAAPGRTPYERAANAEDDDDDDEEEDREPPF